MFLASILFATAGAVNIEIPAPESAVSPRRVAFIDLGRPGAMEALAEENPAHYALVVEALDAARYIGCDGTARMFKARGEGGSVACTDAMLMTSYPPKKRVSV